MPSASDKFYYKILQASPFNWFFRGWYYLTLLAVTIFLLLLTGFTNERVLFVSLSSFLYTAGYLIYGVDWDFRYLYWTVTGTVVALMFLLVELLPKLMGFFRIVIKEMD